MLTIFSSIDIHFLIMQQRHQLTIALLDNSKSFGGDPHFLVILDNIMPEYWIVFLLSSSLLLHEEAWSPTKYLVLKQNSNLTTFVMQNHAIFPFRLRQSTLVVSHKHYTSTRNLNYSHMFCLRCFYKSFMRVLI